MFGGIEPVKAPPYYDPAFVYDSVILSRASLPTMRRNFELGAVHILYDAWQVRKRGLLTICYTTRYMGVGVVQVGVI